MKTMMSGSRHAIRSMRGLVRQCRASINPCGSPEPFNNAAHKVHQRFNLPAILRQPFSTHKSTSPSIKSKTFRTFSSGGSGGGGSSNGGSGGGGGGGNGGSGGLWTAYLALLNRKPIATKAVTAAVLNGIGDAIAQKFLNDGESFDWKRFGIFTFLGLALIGPTLHYWYGSLAHLVTATGTPGAIGRLAMDQFLFAPIFLSAIIGSVMTLEGHAAAVPDKLKNDLFTIVRSNWVLWVPFQFINFRFVPVQLQVLASNVVALAWNTYMSWASHNKAA